MRTVLFSLLAALALVGPARATDFVTPKQTVVGAEKPIPLGELADLSLSPLDDKEKPPHLAGVSSTWKVFDSAGQEKRVREYANGIFFGAGIRKAKLKAVVAVTYLFAVKKEDGTVQEVATRTVLLTQDVIIGDDPGPGPDPNPNPTPNPVAKAWLVVIEETQEATAERGKFLSDPALHEYVQAKKWSVRVADKDVRGPDGKTPPDLAPYIERAAGKKLPQLYVVADTKEVLYEGAVPATPAELLTLLRRLGG